jgi:hypothetical protein
MSKKTARQQLDELLSEFNLSYSVTENEGKFKVTLINGDGKEVVSFTGGTEEAACKEVIEFMDDLTICLQVERILGCIPFCVMIVK